jgi:hypothetical protein
LRKTICQLKLINYLQDFLQIQQNHFDLTVIGNFHSSG